MLLPWQTGAGVLETKSVRGISVGEGRIVLVACLVTVVLVGIRIRPAWISVGFAGAISARAVLDLSGSGGPAAGIGLWIALAASTAAVVLLVWDMFSGVSAGDDDGRDTGSPPKRGLSGPLGRRR